MLSGSGVTSSPGTYPLDIFDVGDGLFSSVANRDFPTAAELQAIGNAAKGAACAAFVAETRKDPAGVTPRAKRLLESF